MNNYYAGGYYANRRFPRYSGVTSKNKTVAWILCAILGVMGIAAIIAAFSIKISSGFSSSSSGDSAVIDGVLHHNITMIKPVKKSLPDGVKALLVVFGIVLILNGLSSLISLISINRSYVEINDRGVTGTQYSCTFFIPQEKRFDIPYNQIQAAYVPNPSALTPTLNILAYNQNFTVKIADAELAARHISGIIGR